MEESLDTRLNRVRILNLNDLDQLNSLIEPHLIELAQKGVRVEAFTSRLHNYLNREKFPDRFLFGYFDAEGKLISIMGLFYWKLMPFATLSYMFVRQDVGVFNADKNGLNLCLHHAFLLGESRGITAFYSLQKATSFRHKQRTWRKNDTEVTKKYYSVPEAKIDANQTSEFHSIWDMMDRQTWPYDTILWVTRLKPKYHEMLNWGEEDITDKHLK